MAFFFIEGERVVNTANFRLIFASGAAQMNDKILMKHFEIEKDNNTYQH